jgi:hypothetical protein
MTQSDRQQLVNLMSHFLSPNSYRQKHTLAGVFVLRWAMANDRAFTCVEGRSIFAHPFP